MTDINDTPNHLQVSGDRGYHCHFGSMATCDPVNLSGVGHWPHVVVRFKFGLKIELDRATASEFARALTESVNALPPVVNFGGADVSGIAVELGEA